MTELETQIWNTVHNWCDAQSNEIPDQNRRYLMDEMKELVLSHLSKSWQDGAVTAQNDAAKEIEKNYVARVR